MPSKILINKNRTQVKKYNLINRFNKSPDTNPFIENFQRIMIDRLLLNYSGEYHKDNIKHIISRNSKILCGYSDKYINTNISGGFILSTAVEAEFYVLLQEKIKDLTGKYMSMNDFLNLLLTWFYQYYTANKKNRKATPFIHNRTQKYKNKIAQLNNTFSVYYKNI